MILKACGILCILSGSIGFSYSFIHNMKNAIRLKRELIRMLRLMDGEIRHRNLNLPECFSITADRLSSPVSDFLKELCTAIKRHEGVTLPKLWGEKASLYFPPMELTQLCKFGEELGFHDQSMQLSAIRQYEILLQAEINETEKKMSETGRIYSALGVLGGVFIVIILI